MKTTVDKPKWRAITGKGPWGPPPQKQRSGAEKLRVALEKIAEYSSPDAIAAMMELEHIKGSCGDSKRCAGAVWLRRETGYDYIRLSYNTAIVFDNIVASFETPGVLFEFYTSF